MNEVLSRAQRKTRPKESTVELLGSILEGMRVRLNIYEKYGTELEYGHSIS